MCEIFPFTVSPTDSRPNHVTSGGHSGVDVLDRMSLENLCSPGMWGRAALVTPDGRPATSIPHNEEWALVSPKDGKGAPKPLFEMIGSDWKLDLSDPTSLLALRHVIAQRMGIPTEYRNFEIMQEHGISMGLTKDHTLSATHMSAFFALVDKLCRLYLREPKSSEVICWFKRGDHWILRLEDDVILFGEKNAEAGKTIIAPVTTIAASDWAKAAKAAAGLAPTAPTRRKKRAK